LKNKKIIGKGRRQCSHGSNLRIGRPDDHKRQETTDDKNREEKAVEQKPPLRFFAHAAKDFGVDDRVIDAGDYFKKT
jgi:hypothetical protein